MYIIESTIYISVFTLFMMIMMKRTTFFRMNRILLVCGTAVCMILPLVDLNVPKASIELKKNQDDGKQKNQRMDESCLSDMHTFGHRSDAVQCRHICRRQA